MSALHEQALFKGRYLIFHFSICKSNLMQIETNNYACIKWYLRCRVPAGESHHSDFLKTWLNNNINISFIEKYKHTHTKKFLFFSASS